jgi:hypothetical protein
MSRWNGQSLPSGQLAKVYGFTNLDGSKPDASTYIREVQDARKADVAAIREPAHDMGICRSERRREDEIIQRCAGSCRS